MNTTVCDRCGKEITPRILKGVDVCLSQTFEKYGISRRSYDLCRDCYEELKAWLKRRDKKEE